MRRTSTGKIDTARRAESFTDTVIVDMQVVTCIWCVVCTVFDALAAEARRVVLDELHDRDGQALFELCTRLSMKHGLEMSRQAISQHLEVLEAAGLVRAERDGRYKFHYINRAPLTEIMTRWGDPDPEEGA